MARTRGKRDLSNLARMDQSGPRGREVMELSFLIWLLAFESTGEGGSTLGLFARPSGEPCILKLLEKGDAALRSCPPAERGRGCRSATTSTNNFRMRA